MNKPGGVGRIVNVIYDEGQNIMHLSMQSYKSLPPLVMFGYLDSESHYYDVTYIVNSGKETLIESR